MSLKTNIQEILKYSGHKNSEELIEKLITSMEESATSDKLFVNLGMILKESGCKCNPVREEIVKAYIAFKNGTKYIIPIERYNLALKTFKKSLLITFKDVIERKLMEE